MTRRGNEIDCEMQDEILFELNSADVSSRAYDIIQSVTDVGRRQSRAMFEGDGYTDNSGTYTHNMDRSQARAEHIADILVRQGIAKQCIIARGFGKTNLAVQTPDGVREPRNRRVIIRIVPPR
jgi:outer membrane protein OmpA-like peptidoglycan-associated protein